MGSIRGHMDEKEIREENEKNETGDNNKICTRNLMKEWA